MLVIKILECRVLVLQDWNTGVILLLRLDRKYNSSIKGLRQWMGMVRMEDSSSRESMMREYYNRKVRKWMTLVI